MHGTHGNIRWIRHCQGGALPSSSFCVCTMRTLALLEKVSSIQRLRRTGDSAPRIWVRKARMNTALSTHDYHTALIRLQQFRRRSGSGVGFPVTRSEISNQRAAGTHSKGLIENEADLAVGRLWVGAAASQRAVLQRQSAHRDKPSSVCLSPGRPSPSEIRRSDCMSVYIYAPPKTFTAETEVTRIAVHAAQLCGCAFLWRRLPRKFCSVAQSDF